MWPFPKLFGCSTKRHVALPYVGWLLHQKARGPSLPTQRLDQSKARASDDDDLIQQPYIHLVQSTRVNFKLQLIKCFPFFFLLFFLFWMIHVSVRGLFQCVLQYQDFSSIQSTHLSLFLHFFLFRTDPLVLKPSCMLVWWRPLFSSIFRLQLFGSWLSVWGDGKGPYGRCGWGSRVDRCECKFLLILNLIF